MRSIVKNIFSAKSARILRVLLVNVARDWNVAGTNPKRSICCSESIFGQLGGVTVLSIIIVS